MSAPKYEDYETTAQWMVAVSLWQKIEEYELVLPLPSPKEISEAMDGAWRGSSLGQYIEAAWEAADEIAYDEFPAFREPPEERDPIEVYGTPEHEAWLVEMERQEG